MDHSILDEDVGADDSSIGVVADANVETGAIVGEGEVLTSGAGQVAVGAFPGTLVRCDFAEGGGVDGGAVDVLERRTIGGQQ